MKRLWLSLVLLFGTLLTVRAAVPVVRPDNICGDNAASFYRNGIIDPIIEKIPATIRNGIKTDPEKYLPLLVQFLQKGADNDFHVVKRLHDWITDNIAYDTDSFYGLGKCSHSPYELVKDGRTTCGGYSHLLEEMCRLSGIEVLYISGISRNYQGPDGSPSGHAWNAVRIKGKWYIVDSTADNRYGYFKKVFSEKSGYKDDNLFITPQAKLMDNYPDKKENLLCDTTLTAQEFLKLPLLDMNILDYNGVKFKNLSDVMTKYQEVKEGGKQIRFYDSLDCAKTTKVIELDCPENILITTSLYDESGKRFDTHHTAYSVKGKVYCVFSAPGKGVWKASIRALYLDRPDTAHTLYHFRVSSENGAGPLLPPPGTMQVNNRIPFSGFRLISDNLDTMNKDGYVRLTWSHPPVYSLYSLPGDGSGQDLKDAVIKDYGYSNTTYYYRLPAKGWYQLPLYIRPLAATNESHQKSAWVSVDWKGNTTPVFPPHLALIRYARFYDNELNLPDGSIVENPAGVYTLRIKVPAGTMLSCALKDADNKNVSRHYAYHFGDDIYTFNFSIPAKKGIYSAKIFHINSKGEYNTVVYFNLQSEGKGGPEIPVPGQLYLLNEWFSSGVSLLDQNLDTAQQDGFYEFHFRETADKDLWLSLYGDDGQYVKGSVTQSYNGTERVFYVIPPDSSYYDCLMYFKYPATEERFNHQLFRFGMRGVQKKFQGAVPPYRLILYKRFQDMGLVLLSGDPADIKKGQAVLKVKTPQGVKLTINIKDAAGNKLKDNYTQSQDGQVYTLTFKKPPQGLYTATIYAAPESEKNYNGVAWFGIE